MNRKATVSVIILIGLMIISLGLAAGASYFYQKEHAKSIQLQEQIDELNARQRVTEDKLEESKKLAMDFQLKLQAAKTQIDSLTGELAGEKTARQEASSKLEQVTADLEQQKAKREDLENKLNQSQEDSKKIKEQIKDIERQKAELEAKIKSLEPASTVELGKVVVNNETSVIDAKAKAKAEAKMKANVPAQKPAKVEKKEKVPQVKSLEGKIVVVNKENNFVVLNLGSKDGVSIGDEFSVSRAGKTIGEVKVEKVHESMSAAGFATELKDIISENDKVAQKAK
jgi:chromosome segregation ATPase